MRSCFLIVSSALVFLAGVNAQPRQFTPMGGGGPDRGKCTVDIVVDGVAEVEIRGGTAILRNIAGQPAYWRRFQCTGPVPARMEDFRFDPQEGRGRQDLVRDPRNGGPAVVRIEDRQGGSEGYKFDIYWTMGYGGGPGPDWDRRGDYRGRRMTTDEAVRACQDYVSQQASDRFRTSDFRFRRINIDDNPGRNDWVVGVLDVHRYGREESYRFSCSVDFGSGRVRSADIQGFGGGDFGEHRGAGASAQALQNCQRAVEDRLRHDRYRRIDFGNVSVDNRPGRNDWVIGDVRADREPYEFSCSVNLNTGDVRSVDVRRR